MNRREFLLGIGAAGILVSSTKLISIPSEKFKQNYNNDIWIPYISEAQAYGENTIAPGIYTRKMVMWDPNSPFKGTFFPMGTFGQPVNNMEDAIKIAKHIGEDPNIIQICGNRYE